MSLKNYSDIKGVINNSQMVYMLAEHPIYAMLRYLPTKSMKKSLKGKKGGVRKSVKNFSLQKPVSITYCEDNHTDGTQEKQDMVRKPALTVHIQNQF